MKKDLTFYGGDDHFLARWNQWDDDRVYLGRLHREDIERYDVNVVLPKRPTLMAEGVLLSGEMHEQLPFETIPANLRVERDGELVQDTFIGEQTVIVNLRRKGLVVVTACSHRGVIGICQHAVRISGISRVHAVVGGFHLPGLSEDRIARVVDAFRTLGVEYIVPQHCTGFEAAVGMAQGLRDAMVVSSVGSRFVFDSRS